MQTEGRLRGQAVGQGTWNADISYILSLFSGSYKISLFHSIDIFYEPKQDDRNTHSSFWTHSLWSFNYYHRK